MKTLSIQVLTAAAMALTLGSAFAQDANKMQAKFDKHFAAADTNGDGKLSREEAKAMPRLAAHFDEIDTGKTGFITKDQVLAAMKAHGARHGASAPQ